VHVVAGHLAPNLAAYRITFLVAGSIALIGVAAALSINDADAARTMVDPRLRRSQPAAARAPTPASDASG
jgi:hypothetical protein